jgi:methyltransferase (TIGR00027 family)
MLLEDISDTARWVAHFRALESERNDRILNDPFARRLAGERGRKIAETLPKLSLEWVIPVRTKVYDELILETVRATSDDVTAVLNLAAGLDVRPYRLTDLPPKLRWIEVDLPGIIAQKIEALKDEQPCCVVERIGLDLTSDGDAGAMSALLSRLATERVVVVTEGLLAYLDEQQVASLARSLFACDGVQSWILEATSREVLTQARRAWGRTLVPAGAEMKFASGGFEFFAPFGWHPRTTRSLLEEAHRLKREMPQVSLKRAVTILLRGRETWRRMAMYAVMEKSQTA